MSEKAAYHKIKDKVFSGLDRVDRVENALTVGMPDVNYCINCIEGWIEIKSPKEPKRANTKLFGSNHPLSQDQKNWMLRQRNAGGLCWILIDTCNWVILVNGAWADEINELTLEEILDLSAFSARKPVSKELWQHFRKDLAKWTI